MRDFLKYLLKPIHFQELRLWETTSNDFNCTKKFLETKAKMRLLLTATCSFSILGAAASIR